MNAELNQAVRMLNASVDGAPIVIGLVAASGYAVNTEAVARGIENLQAQGCIVKNFSDAERKFQRFGATDDERIAQLYAAATDPEVDIVMALRGGYGLTRLLPELDFKLLAESGKLFVGHSDFTALQMGLLAHSGATSFAGPMLCDDFVREELSAYTLNSFWRCVAQAEHALTAQVAGNPELEVSGTLWGGNLAMLAHLVGSPYLPRVEGGILFVEDVNEHPYRVERMVLQLLHAGVLDSQQALLLGDFSAYRLTDYDNGYDFEQMVAYLRAHLPIPVLTGLPFGHGRDKATLAVGARATLSSQADGFSLSMQSYPGLKKQI
ncbi:muramoyltetrapeptide carboxypeptidase [Herminiimonas sp. KBW02]|uniref:muramoyltetrapeptide carboxypeptidase n=1 Tax=Herminiimonas sp. KBW02 TaxID=2153363 RepID=UPI000F5A3B8B|nr:muramoyltetrapeptide carboxypeptidase [Herminiimonas sp. KBW02]RQO36302.1 muramoyltetrapeptide carboxypeptidase [Herminiimonas sp. KBW02]